MKSAEKKNMRTTMIPATRILVVAMLSGLLSTPALGALMQYSYYGHITGVDIQASDQWSADQLLGANIEGHVTMDVAGLYLREVADFFWYDDNDVPPGILTSEVRFAGETYILSSAFDDGAGIIGDNTNEFIEVLNGPRISEGSLVSDTLRFSDKEAQPFSDTDPNSGYAEKTKTLSIFFKDSINDFLRFPDWVSGETPNLVQEFTWRDLDLEDGDQEGGGEFEYIEYVDWKISSPDQRYVDYLKLDFVLTEVVATIWTPDSEGPPVDEVPAPAPLTILGGAALFWWLYRRQLHPGFGACSMGGGR